MSKTTKDERLIKAHVEKYKTVTAASGNKSLDSGDEVAKALRGKELGDVYEVAAKKLGTSALALKRKYGHLNVGMQRMNLGNRVRAANNPKKGAK